MAKVGSICLTLDDGLYAGIGAVISRWATLEFLLQNIIWRAMGLENAQGRVLTVGMPIEKLAGILRNLPNRWITDETVKADLKALLDDIRETVDLRNYLAHGIWTTYPDEQHKTPHLNFMKTGPQKIMPGAQPITAEELRLTAESIHLLNVRASVILRVVGGVQLSSPDKPE